MSITSNAGRRHDWLTRILQAYPAVHLSAVGREMKQRATNYCPWLAHKAGQTGKFRRYPFEITVMPEMRRATLRRARNPMPTFVRNALDERGLMGAFLERPPYQRNDYLGWILRAKLEATRLRRLNRMLDELQGGRLYMNMTWRPRGSRAGSR